MWKADTVLVGKEELIMWKQTIGILASTSLMVATLSGCVLDRTTHTLFIEEDGSITWRVLQDYVRSDEENPAKRDKEEEDYLVDVETREDTWTTKLDAFGPTEMDSWLIRDRRPYTLWVEARFEDPDALAHMLLDAQWMEGDASVKQDGERYTMDIQMTLEPKDYQTYLDLNTEEFAAFGSEHRVVLARGRFVEATGFDLSDDRTVAVVRKLDAEEMEAMEGTTVAYSLSWDLSAP